MARELGRALADRGIILVFGAGSGGLMGALAEACLDAGGVAVGVIPRFLLEVERPHPGLTRLEVVETMHQRKARMLELADAFGVLPGGLGTLEELFEFWTGQLLGVHRKPIGWLDRSGFFEPLERALAQLQSEGFVVEGALERLIRAREPEELLERLASAVEKDAGRDALGRF